MAPSLKSDNGDDPKTREEAEAILRQMSEGSGALAPLIAAGFLRSDAPKQNRQAMAERRYRALVEQIPVVTFLAALDEDIQELYVSPQIENLLGFTQEQWLENPFLWYNRLHPDDRQRWAEEFARTCATGAEFREEYRLIARDGRVVWVHGECRVIRDEEGNPLFLQGVAYDITESKEAQEVLRRTSQELEQRVQERTAELRAEIRQRQQLADQLAEEGRQKDQFLAVLAHELRNPLSPILPALDLLRQEDDGQQRRWAIEMIGRQVQHMSSLIDDLLDISRISRGKISLQKSAIDLRLVLDRAIEVVRPLVQNRRHRLMVQESPQRIFVDGDPVRLEQIITNLLANAAKYTEPGGLIEVEMSRDERDAILRVRDNGIGIPPEMLNKIFEMFTQVNTSFARPAQWGLGIGLALVRGLVQLHGGTVTAHSAGEGKGSEFTVRLPLLLNENCSPAPAVDKSSNEALPRRKILIVEDSPDTARALFLMMRAWGQDVATVPDGAAALAEIGSNPPEVIFMDIGVPGMDGYEVARRIRQAPSGGRIILVALSGYGQPEDRRRAYDAGFDLHLTKPVEVDSLHRLLANPDQLIRQGNSSEPRQ
jgi:PAS domain S-box-containing protein